ncbi:MAG: Holliday junction branch migration protein RuvA [Clostridiales bacterium]|nr:Holliday junction branch migration protein RuvA [Clostridiales bacterium]
MLYHITGELKAATAAYAVVDCGGVGFQCYTTLNTLKKLGSPGGQVTLYTHLNVREDAMELYGFYDLQELEFFKLLVSVSGIGPKAALAILSELAPARLALCIAAGDAKALMRAQGVGKKGAERVVLELKDKVGGIGGLDESVGGALEAVEQAGESGSAAEAVEALVALGFQRADAAAAVAKMDASLSADELIRQGLKQLARQV